MNRNAPNCDAHIANLLNSLPIISYFFLQPVCLRSFGLSWLVSGHIQALVLQ